MPASSSSHSSSPTLSAASSPASSAASDSGLHHQLKSASIEQVNISAASDVCSLPAGEDTRLPVTILSGFLGSGKTTLLEYILKGDHGLRCAVIINDMGEVNIDAALVDTHKTIKKEGRIVEMSNGCICCTLRGDLLEEVAALAEEKAFDYLIIESSGISEPQQVAETFAPEFADMHLQAAEDLREEAAFLEREAAAGRGPVAGEEEMAVDGGKPKPTVEETLKLAEILADGGLPKIARLDTMVTVVDALSLFDNFATADYLSDRKENGEVGEEDERNISDLLVDQLEWANVLILNKCDLVSASQRERAVSLLRTLNPTAKIITSVHSKIDLQEILDTRKFAFETAALSAGWLKSLREELKPETEEYGIGSFVYRARRPFSPLRLWEVIRTRLVVIQDSYEPNEDGMEVDSDDGSDASSDKSWEDEADPDAQPQLDPIARLAAKKADPAFGPLLRSKGFFWLATRPQMSGEWSQAGVMLTIQGGSPWICETDPEGWPEHPEVRKKMLADFEGKWGDRRQELVFIGEQLETTRPLLTAELDAALLDDGEWAQWQKIMKSKKPLDKKIEKLEQVWDDGFEDWLDETDEEVMEALGGHAHDH